MPMFVSNFDKRITKDIQRLPAGLMPVMRAATFIGLPIFTTSIGVLLAVTGLLRMNEKLFQAGVVVIVVIVIGTVFKLLLRRNRPITDYVLNMRFASYSLPSGHSVGSMVAYGSLGYVLASSVAPMWGVPITIISLITAITIGVSRIYLGAHYPTDVIAGWLLGASGLLIVITIVQPQL